MTSVSADMPWVIFHLLNEKFAISANHIREMVAMPNLVLVPKTPDHIRGVINLRGQVLPVMDLRIRMGMPSLLKEINELVELLTNREQDHKNWMAELELSIEEKREFKLTTDPHKCAFGLWYDSYETKNGILDSCLRKFDAPHKRIHGIGIEVKKLEEAGDFNGALALVQQTKDTDLSKMIELFAEARALLTDSSSEIAMVLEWNNKSMAIGIDSVETVEKLSESDIGDLPELANTVDNECIFGIGQRGASKELIQLIDVGKLIGQEADLPVNA